MAKTEQKTGRNSGQTVNILLAVICIVLCALSIYFYRACDSLNTAVLSDDAELSELLAIYDEKSAELAEVTETREAFNDLDGKIAEIKEVYFKNAVKAEELARSGNADFKVCYLTFDDGPYVATTPLFLDVLEEYDVQATFFCLAKEGLDDLYKREKMNCHTIGNHTASHTIRYVYSSIDTFIKDLEENREFIQNLLGITTDVMRFPGRSPQITYSGLNRTKMIERIQELHYGYIDWTLMTGDGGGPYFMTPDEFLHNVVDYSADYDVISVLMHDYSNNTLACLPEMIEILKEQGYIFLPLSYDAPIVKKE